METGAMMAMKGYTVARMWGPRYVIVSDPDGNPMQVEAGRTQKDAHWMVEKLDAERTAAAKDAFRREFLHR